MSRTVLTERISICCARAEAAARTSETKGSVMGHLESTSTPMRAAPGRNSCKSPSCFAPSSVEMKLTPVTLPPGRLRRATRPSLTGSAPGCEDDRYRRGCGLCCNCRQGVVRSDHRHLTAYQIGCEVGQSIILVLRPAILNRYILAFDVAAFADALPECSHKMCSVSRR